MKTANRFGHCPVMVFIFILLGCQKEDLPYYTNTPGVYFNGSSWSYSFIEDPAKSVDTLGLPVLISGNKEAFDRIFRAEVIPDSTTAPAELFQLLDGTVKAESFDGILPVVVRKADILQDTVFRIQIRLIPTEDFTELRLGTNSYQIDFTAKVIQPANWWDLHWYFGEYSTLWWKKIIMMPIPENP